MLILKTKVIKSTFERPQKAINVSKIKKNLLYREEEFFELLYRDECQKKELRSNNALLKLFFDKESLCDR